MKKNDDKKKRNDGKNFELLTKTFFSFIFDEIGYIVHKGRMQFNGTQDGFDIQFVICKDNIERNIFIECKDYSTDLKFGNIYPKAHDLESNYNFDKNDVAIFISPRANFANSKNPEKSEPIFNSGKFPFQIRLLDKSNGIDNLFAIDKEIYCEIYKVNFEKKISKDKEIKKFKSILHSRGNLKTIIINEEHRYNYITNIKELDYLIPRTISESKKLNKKQIRYFSNNSLSHIENLKFLVSNLLINDKTDGIILLGNPGFGKSIELKQLALFFWKNRELENCIPFFRSISTFINTSSITDYLPENWKNIPRLIIILDGLDEISEGHNFKAKLEKFIIDHKNNRTIIKFILSCRTNTYESSIKNIPNFKLYFLDEIHSDDALDFLKNKYSLSLKNLNQNSLIENQRDFLTNPYFLNLFGEYYKENKIIPTNKCDLISKYIDKRLKDDRETKYKNRSYDISLIKTYCKKTALAMEAMQVNKISDSYLNLLLESNKNTFTNCCFIEKVYNEDNWMFEHRNLQEFFVANALANLSFKNIINFISITKTNKTHPSWLNSISYLINLLDVKSEKYKKLIDWLKKFDSTILFKVDSNRISIGLKINIFQDFFNLICKKQTLWIRVYDLGIKELALFGNCEENISFLIREVKDKTNHRRARISAFELLSNMDFLLIKKKIELLILELLSSPIDSIDFRFKSNIIYIVKKIDLHKNGNFIHEIIKALGDYDHHTITNTVLQLIEDSDPDEFFKYIKNVTPKIINDELRIYTKKDIISTDSQKDTLNNILLKFSSLEHLIFSLKFYFENKYLNSFRLKEEGVKGIISKIIQLNRTSKNVYKQMLNFIINDFKGLKFLFKYEEVFSSFFHETNTSERAFKDIFDLIKNYSDDVEFEFELKRHFLAELVTNKNINLIANEFINSKVNEKQIFYFRNIISHKDFKLGLKFQKIITSKTSYKFNNDLLDTKIRLKWSRFHRNKEQLDFDIFFNKKKLINLTKIYFLELGKEKVIRDDMLEYRKEYYQDVDLQIKYSQSFFNLLHNTFNEFGNKISKEDVIQLLNSDLYLINEIKEKIHSTNKNNYISNSRGFKIKQKQVEYVENWCNSNISKVIFHNFCSCKSNKKKCYLLWFFRNQFEFTFPNNILLDMLSIDSSMSINGKKIGYDYIIDRVDKQELKKRIIININSGYLTSDIFESHALYALENNIESVYPKIKTYIKKDKYLYYRAVLLEKYIEKTNDISLLKELVKPNPIDENANGLTWRSIELLLSKKENNFVINKLLEFIKIDKTNKNKLTSIKYLIRANYENAFLVFNEWLKSNIKEYKSEVHYLFRSDDWKLYNNPKSIPHLMELIKIGNNKSYFFDEYSKPIRIVLDILTNICQNSNPETCLLIIKKIEKCKKVYHFDKFYFNTIINNTWETYYTLKSKPIPFSEIAKKIEGYRYKII